jgi:hypothetical protein
MVYCPAYWNIHLDLLKGITKMWNSTSHILELGFKPQKTQIHSSKNLPYEETKGKKSTIYININNKLREEHREASRVVIWKMFFTCWFLHALLVGSITYVSLHQTPTLLHSKKCACATTTEPYHRQAEQTGLPTCCLLCVLAQRAQN